MFPRPIQHRSQSAQWVYAIALPIALILWLFPLIGVAITSVRPAADLAAGNYFGIPSHLAWENYADVFQNTPMLQYIKNSFIVTIPTVIGSVALSLMTGFALAIYKFKANLILFFMFVAGNFVPAQILMVPVRDMTLNLGMYNTYWGLALFHIAFQTGFCTLFMRNFIKALPFELIEAARVEGVTDRSPITTTSSPDMRPAIAALSVLVFPFIWNDFFWATVMTQGVDSQPITAGLSSLNGQWIAQWHLVSAGSILAALPPVAMFFLMQKHFIAGLTLGAVK